MGLIRAQTILPYWTGLPEDVSTNVSYWQYDGSVAGAATLTEIHDRLSAAYQFIGSVLSPVIFPRLARIKMYDMGHPTPRQPLLFTPSTFTLPSTSASTTVPQEACVVMSYHGAQVSGSSPARQRGRMYLGPLTSGAIDPGSSTKFPTIHANTMTAVVNFASALRTPINGAASVVWSQYSPTDGDHATVVGMWVDNEPDTQRRRGVRATARTVLDLS